MTLDRVPTGATCFINRGIKQRNGEYISGGNNFEPEDYIMESDQGKKQTIIFQNPGTEGSPGKRTIGQVAKKVRPRGKELHVLRQERREKKSKRMKGGSTAFRRI